MTTAESPIWNAIGCLLARAATLVYLASLNPSPGDRQRRRRGLSGAKSEGFPMCRRPLLSLRSQCPCQVIREKMSHSNEQSGICSSLKKKKNVSVLIMGLTLKHSQQNLQCAPVTFCQQPVWLFVKLTGMIQLFVCLIHFDVSSLGDYAKTSSNIMFWAFFVTLKWFQNNFRISLTFKREIGVPEIYTAPPAALV